MFFSLYVLWEINLTNNVETSHHARSLDFLSGNKKSGLRKKISLYSTQHFHKRNISHSKSTTLVSFNAVVFEKRLLEDFLHTMLYSTRGGVDQISFTIGALWMTLIKKLY